MATTELKSREKFHPPIKKLFVPNGFAGLGDDSGSQHGVFTIRQEFEIRRAFESTGCSLAVGGNDYMDGSFGIFSGASHQTALELRGNLTERIGVMVPSVFAITEAAAKLPAVAKYPKHHGGDGIFLIEDTMQLAKLKAKMFMQHTNILRMFPGSTGLHEMAERVLHHVLSDTIHPDIEGALVRIADNYPLEEFIETPGSYDASFRVVADGHGALHYGALIRSRMRKRTALAVKTGRVDEDHKWNGLLEDPLSPLFLNAKIIVSNEAQGGLLIMLNGNEVTDVENAAVLVAHGVNPARPRVPVRMLDVASRIGKLSKAIFPYVGVDFVLNQNDIKTPVLLEVNACPVIYPSELGITDKVPDWYSLKEQRAACMMEMMRRVANYKPIL